MIPSLLVAELIHLRCRSDSGARGIGKRFDGHDHHVLVEHVSVLDTRPHRQRGGLFPAVEEHRRPGDAHQRRLTVADLVDEFVERALGLFPCLGDDLDVRAARSSSR